MLISLTSKRLVYRLTKHRVFAISFVLGITGFWIWQSQTRPQTISRAFIVTFPPEPPKPESILQDRNLAEYEQISFSDCRFVREDNQKCEEELDNGRRLVLDLWEDKKRAYVLYSVRGYHGGVDYHIFIEPDNSGNWHIVRRWKQYYTTVGWENLFRIDSTKAFSVEPFRKTDDDDIYRDGKFYLKFFDKNGKEIDTL